MPPEPTPSPTPAPSPSTPTTPTTPEASLTDGTSSLLSKAIEGAPPEPKPEPAPEPAKPAAGAPEKYEFKLPEGATLEGPVLEEVTGLLKKHGLSNEAGQELVDFHAKQMKDAAAGPYKLWSETQETWLDEIKSSPDLGPKFTDGTLGASVSKMISTLPVEQAKAFRDALNFTGVGNNPAIVRGLFAISQRFTEPGHVQGTAPAKVTAPGQARPTAAGALYPDLPSANKG